MKNVGKNFLSVFFVAAGVLAVGWLLVGPVFANLDTKAGVSLVANAKVGVDSLSKGEVRKIFMGKQTVWPGVGKNPVVFVTLKDGASHKAFLKGYLGKTPKQYASYWKKLVFTGKGKAPRSFKTEKDLLVYVTKTVGAVGYIGSKTASAAKNIKIISVKKK